MNENNSISYDENWQSVSSSEYPVVASHNFDDNESEPDEELQERQRPKQRKPPSQLLLTIQLIICILIALAALVLKNIGGDIYAFTHDWYYSNLNNSAIFDGNSDFDINSLFGRATPDEV